MHGLKTMGTNTSGQVAPFQCSCHLLKTGHPQVVQQHCHAQAREHAQLVDAHTKLGLPMPSAASLAPGQQADRPPSPVAAVPAVSSTPQGHPAGFTAGASGQAAIAAATPPAVPAVQADEPGGMHGPDISVRTRNRLLQELQRFDLPQELRQMLMSIPLPSTTQQEQL